MLGTIVNVLAILLGSFLGIVVKRGLSDKMKTTVLQGIGLVTMVIGLKMAFDSDNDLLVIISIVIGGVIGEILKLDKRLDGLGDKIKSKMKIEDNNFVNGFVSASLIFCVGAMAIMGSIESGLHQNHEILFLKSILDCVTSMVLASSLGVGVAFSALAVLVYQGAITLLAVFAESFLIDPVIMYMSAVGGILIMAIGMDIAGIKQINVANLLPGIFVAAIVATIANSVI